MARAKGKGYFAGRGRYVVGVYAGLIDTRMAPDYDQPKTRAAAAGRDQARPRLADALGDTCADPTFWKGQRGARSAERKLPIGLRSLGRSLSRTAISRKWSSFLSLEFRDRLRSRETSSCTFRSHGFATGHQGPSR